MGEQSDRVPVRYVGNKPEKYDTVCGSRARWTPGSVERVSRVVAERLLQHPMVWREDEAPVVEQAAASDDSKPVHPNKEAQQRLVEQYLSQSAGWIVAETRDMEPAIAAQLLQAEKHSDNPRVTVIRALEQAAGAAD